MFGHLLAALTAWGWSLRYQRVFRIDAKECKRYWQKSVNLALCYRGFAFSSKPSSIIGAGKAAFFCCAYDVITDWRNFDPSLFKRFESCLQRSLPPQAVKLAIDLYWQEKMNLLTEDGLSRGPTSLKFVSMLIGTESFIRQNTDFDYLGTIMQIVDDVLDVEEDERENKMNSLLSPKRDEYLAMLVEFPVAEMESFLPKGEILWKVVRSSQEKAEKLLSFHDRRASEPFVNIDYHPHHNVS